MAGQENLDALKAKCSSSPPTIKRQATLFFLQVKTQSHSLKHLDCTTLDIHFNPPKE